MIDIEQSQTIKQSLQKAVESEYEINASEQCGHCLHIQEHFLSHLSLEQTSQVK
jgi:hypothetical protein